MSKANDWRMVFNGLAKVAESAASIQKSQLDTMLKNSSIRSALEVNSSGFKQPSPKDVQDLLQRAAMIPSGLMKFATLAPKFIRPQELSSSKSDGESSQQGFGRVNAAEVPHADEVWSIREEDLQDLRNPNANVMDAQEADLKRDPPPGYILNQKKPEPSISSRSFVADTVSSDEQRVSTSPNDDTPRRSGIKPLSKTKPSSQLGNTSKERTVPASRIGRLVSYGSLAAGLGFGALAEVTKRSFGLKDNQDGNAGSLLGTNPFLSEANAQRIVDTLCRVRGAALKIGQILSIQDNSMINPELQKVFERVRHSADFMPSRQMGEMMRSEFGDKWRTLFSEFDEKPFAAASIGQVHLGKLHDGRPVAVKIQYPGVAKGIESDIDNLITVLNVWDILPAGIFMDAIIPVAKRELAWEVDYIRESDCARRFRKLLEPYEDYYVPEVIGNLSTKQVYTTELIEGVPVDHCETLDQETRDRVSFLLLDLFFRELVEFRFMQTDPNWSNFLYNTDTKQIGLLDFGASREYKQSFVDLYIRILKAASENNKKEILEYSRQIGFLTGYESKIMENAHMETVMLLSEGFRVGDESYDFGRQDITQRIQSLVPVMVKHRLCPPPEEIYSLHRKLSGVFLLCTKLRGRVKCRPILERSWKIHQANVTKDTD